jgi:hypothetical protein
LRKNIWFIKFNFAILSISKNEELTNTINKFYII